MPLKSIFNSLPRGGVFQSTAIPVPKPITTIRQALKHNNYSNYKNSTIPLRARVYLDQRRCVPLAARVYVRSGISGFSRKNGVLCYDAAMRAGNPPSDIEVNSITMQEQEEQKAQKTKSHPHPRTLEVERKFIPTPFSIALLRKLSSSTGPCDKKDENAFPCTYTYTYKGKSHIHDIYYDPTPPSTLDEPDSGDTAAEDISTRTPNGLMVQGIYLRRRNGAWEVKRHINHASSSSGIELPNGAAAASDTTSLAEEVVDPEGVYHVLAGVFVDDAKANTKKRVDEGQMRSMLESWAGKPVADFVTVREEWVVTSSSHADKDTRVETSFNIVIDVVDFTQQDSFKVHSERSEARCVHVVGEVELVAQVDVGGEEKDAEVMKGMERGIEEFMRENRELFPVGREVGKVKGKLAAWFEWVGGME